jgi:hypothetical protein
MNLKKYIFLGLLLVFVVIQFIQPTQNKSDKVLLTDVQKIYGVPVNVSAVLQTSCYDCHNNNTHYPWYAKIQPGAWLMASHIKKGKAMLNFSEFGELSIRKQQSKLMDIINQIKDGEMPISSYTLIHQNAKLSASQKSLVITWAYNLKDSLSVN